MHIDAIIEQIDLYMTSIDMPVTVVEFGESTLPSPPYIVVKQSGGDIIVTGHMEAGQQSYLRQMMYRDIADALIDQTLTDSDGSTTRLRGESTPSGLINTNDDGTISQERLFSKPDRIF